MNWKSVVGNRLFGRGRWYAYSVITIKDIVLKLGIKYTHTQNAKKSYVVLDVKKTACAIVTSYLAITLLKWGFGVARNAIRNGKSIQNITQFIKCRWFKNKLKGDREASILIGAIPEIWIVLNCQEITGNCLWQSKWLWNLKHCQRQSSTSL